MSARSASRARPISGALSLEGLAAYQFGTFTGFAGKALLAYYPTDNLRIDGGVRYLEGPGAIGMIDAEWQPHAGSGLTLYASGSFGDDYTQALGGVRYYFGDTGKSLIRRHREDDPVTEGGNSLPGDLFETRLPGRDAVIPSTAADCGVPIATCTEVSAECHGPLGRPG